MDPLAGLSLACNLMQVIQFSAETLAVFKRLNEGRSPDPFTGANTQSLVTATTKLKSTLNTPSVINGIPRDASLLQVCNEIVLVADALQKQVHKTLPSKGESKTKLLRKTVAFQLKYKSATDKLSRQLDKLQHRMESEILIDLRQTLTQDRSDVVDGLRTLDQDLKDFCNNLIAGHTRLEDLVDRESGEIKKAIANEAQETRDRNARSAQETRDLINATHDERMHVDAYERFLGSFRFPDINARRNAIEISHNDTFEWIFDEPEGSQSDDDIAPSWSNFPEWLRSGTGLYWISGKAGAGKSTLMKFLLHNHKTKSILSENDPDTMIVSAFIWSLGSGMQKTLTGVLCTLLYDIFAQDREHCWRLMKQIKGGFELKQESSDWSLPELVSLFSMVAKNYARPLCVFIDGLDEIDRSKPTEITRLIEWLESARNLNNLQICVSSRPEPTFDSRLREHPHLRVQDLTAKDIERYVSDTLRKIEFDSQPSTQDIQDLIRDIVNRAEGVFLWAHLVVEHIRVDADSFPKWENLVQRVEELPSGLHSMYETMWKRQNGDSDIYRAETASYLNYLLVRKFCTLLHLTLRFNTNIQNMILKGEMVSMRFLIEECSRFDVNVVARCGGLVTSSGIPPPRLLPACEEGLKDLETRILAYFAHPPKLQIGFGHRSAADFLLSTSIGHRILSYDKMSAMEHAICQAKVELCLGILTGGQFWINMAITTVSPIYHEFRLPRFASTAFDLILDVRKRRPGWMAASEQSNQQGNTGLAVHVAAWFVRAGFHGPLFELLDTLPANELNSMRKLLLERICQTGGFFEVDLVIGLLGRIRPEDVSCGTPSSPNKLLVEVLLCYAERLLVDYSRQDSPKLAVTDKCRQLVDLILHKFGGIECLLKWRTTAMLYHRQKKAYKMTEATAETMYQLDCLHMPCGRFGLDYQSGQLSAILVETSILDAFFRTGSPLRKLLADLLGQIGQARIQKLVMVVHFTKRRDLMLGRPKISGFNSKTLGELELKMELHEVMERLRTPGITSPHNMSTEDVCALFHAEKSGNDVTLNSDESLEFLIEKGYISQDRVDHANPLRALFFEDGREAESNPQKFDEVDWSFEIDCKPFEEASRVVIEREQKAGNLKAFAPCNGGMKYQEARKQWDNAWNRWHYDLA